MLSTIDLLQNISAQNCKLYLNFPPFSFNVLCKRVNFTINCGNFLSWAFLNERCAFPNKDFLSTGVITGAPILFSGNPSLLLLQKSVNYVKI